jgi:hypothetical protein
MKFFLLSFLFFVSKSETKTSFLSNSLVGSYLVKEVNLNDYDDRVYKKMISESLVGSVYTFKENSEFSITSKDSSLDEGTYEINEDSLILYFPKLTSEIGKGMPVKSYYKIDEKIDDVLILNHNLNDSVMIRILLKKKN